MNTAHDYAHTSVAADARAAKARTLAAWLWDRGVGSDDLGVMSAAVLRKVAREAGVTPPSSTETWDVVGEALQARGVWAAGNPTHPLALRAVPEDRCLWAPEPPRAAAVAAVKGWAALCELGPIRSRIDSRCLVCHGPAVVGTLTGWRCGEHPPMPGEWGHLMDWTPHGGSCAPAVCHCGRCPTFRLAPITEYIHPPERRRKAPR